MNDSLCTRRCAPVRWSATGLCFVLFAATHLVRAQGSADSGASNAPAPGAGPNRPNAPAAQTEPTSDTSEEDEAATAQAELEAEEKASAMKAQKPAPKGKGVLWGTVTDTKFDEAIVEAEVQVVGRKEKAFADIDGRFRLELPPGNYKLRVRYELHRPSVVEIPVKVGELTRIDFKLVPDEGAVEEVVIEEKADQSSAESQTLERKRSSSVGDGVGRAEIARTPDRNAAEAAQRIVGATIVDNKFVYVRGLGERYTNALLNGSPLPSTEPDRNTVPLDLFPSLVLDSLNITKQFLPDMPADFAGGSVRIKTRDFPKQPLFQLSVAGAYNTESTGRKRPGYQGSSTDWLGFDGGARGLPSSIPNRRLDQSATTTQEQISYGHRLNSPLITFKKGTPPNFGVTMVAGNSYKVGPDAKLGLIAALNYGQSYVLQNRTQRTFSSGPLPDGTQSVLVAEEYTGQHSIDSVRWGTFGSAALELSHRHTISLVAFHSQNADDHTWDLESSGSDGLHATHLEYVSRALNFLQLRGEHHFPTLSDLEIDWNTSYSIANRDQPDTRDVRYRRDELNGIPGWSYVPDQSGEHQFLTQTDTSGSAGFDVLQPLIKAIEHETSIKGGALLTTRRREFRARRFQFLPSRDPGFLFNQLSFCPGASYSGGCPNYLFRPELIRPDGLLLNEWTQGFDQYKTGLDVYAAYGMIDTKILPKLRVIGGVRAEITFQTFDGFDPFDPAGAHARSNIFRTDWLPAASVVYELTPKSNARFGASQTLARPQLRELSPAVSTNAAGDRQVAGNPGLTMTKITNLDLRYEYFPTLREVLAASLFYKHFRSPIEEVVSGTGLLGYTNAPQANLYGAELEGRKSLEVLAAALRDFSVLANFTLVYSNVHFGARKAAATTDDRPLAYQSPYVVNVSLDYSNLAHGVDARLLYNVYGPRITAVGSNSLPDEYEMPRHSLDLSASKKFAQHLELKLQAQNILAAPVVFAYRNQQGFKPVGPLQFESLGRQPATRTWNPGTTFTATATYTY
jgi:TonB-dependent receptor